ncbi:MAG: phage holin family protein [Solirubrobacterales bacterium]|nr:phage holin family protein [Solirubrobacterales bacterium]
MPTTDQQPPNDFAAAVSQVTAKAQLLVREEFALAKTEVTEKLTSLTKGTIVAAAAAVFAVAGLLFLGHAIAWGLYALFFNDVFWGYLIVAGSLFILGGLAAYLAARALKAGAPPTPALAIDEAHKIRDLVDAARSTPFSEPLVAPTDDQKPRI